MSDIESIIAQGRLALRKDGADLKSVAAAMLEDEPYDEARTAEPAKRVEMSDALVHALGVLPAVFGSRQVTEIRQLTEEELRLLGEEQITISEIVKPLETRLEAIKETVRHHMDLTAVADGKVSADTERDSHGHVVVARKSKPEQVAIPGQNKVWSREYRAGRVDIDGARLLDLYETGEITREQYLSFTKAIRVFDEDKAFNAMAKDPSLIGVFRRIIKKGRPGTSLFLRNKK